MIIWIKWNIKKQNIIRQYNKSTIQIYNKKWVKITDNRNKLYAEDKKIKLKTSILQSSFCDYTDSYILVTETVSIWNPAFEDAHASNSNIKVIFKKPFTIQKLFKWNK